MYNRDIKIKYISENTNSITETEKYVLLFNTIEEIENRINGDICTAKEEDIQDIMNLFSETNYAKKTRYINMLKKYVLWYKDNCYPNASDAILAIDLNISNDAKKQYVYSPAHLEHYLNCIFHSPEDETPDDVYRCFMWLAYSGMTEDDILSVTSKHVDLCKMVIKYLDKEYPIYRYAVPVLTNCINLNKFLVVRKSNQEILIDRMPGDTLVRGLGKTDKKYVRVRISKTISTCFDEGKVDFKLNYFRVWISGVFYRAHEFEMLGGSPDFYPLIENRRSSLGKSSAKNPKDIRNLIYQMHSQYVRDYEVWKSGYISQMLHNL